MMRLLNWLISHWRDHEPFLVTDRPDLFEADDMDGLVDRLIGWDDSHDDGIIPGPMRGHTDAWPREEQGE